MNILQPPTIVDEWKLQDLPCNFTWTVSEYKKMTNLFTGSDRLFDKLSKTGYKSAVGVAAVLTELIWWRLNGNGIDKNKNHQDMTACLWAGAIDPAYIKTSEFDYKIQRPDGVQSPFRANWYMLQVMIQEYMEGSFYIHQYLENIYLLARHVMPNQRRFVKWFDAMMQRANTSFPWPYDYDDLFKKGINMPGYDCSNDAPIPREFFFDENFVYSKTAAKPLLSNFLQQLDYKSNPWLCTPEEMIAKGFKGTPYTI